MTHPKIVGVIGRTAQYLGRFSQERVLRAGHNTGPRFRRLSDVNIGVDDSKSKSDADPAPPMSTMDVGETVKRFRSLKPAPHLDDRMMREMDDDMPVRRSKHKT